jgi:hypothetical protein
MSTAYLKRYKQFDGGLSDGIEVWMCAWTVQLLFLNIFLHHSYFASFHLSFISCRPMRYRQHISEVTKNSMADLVRAWDLIERASLNGEGSTFVLNIFLHHSYFASFHSSLISSRSMRYRQHISEVTKNSMADIVRAWGLNALSSLNGEGSTFRFEYIS